MPTDEFQQKNTQLVTPPPNKKLLRIVLPVVLCIFGVFLFLRLSPQSQVAEDRITPTNVITPKVNPTSAPYILDQLNKKLQVQNTQVSLVHSYITSPYNEHVAILAHIGLTPFALYISDLHLEKLTWVGLATDVAWSTHGKYLAYLSPRSDAGPDKIYVFDVGTKKHVEVIDPTAQAGCPMYSYSAITWVDEKQIKANRSIMGGDCTNAPAGTSSTTLLLP